MICLDTNVAIYIANSTISTDLADNGPVFYASVTRIEALGFWNITSVEEDALRTVFSSMIEVPLSDEVAGRAIKLRQLRRMGLGDAIIAATALEHDCELWTANTGDFAGIDGLKLYNPLEA